ncbi:hypothetical protein GGR54DRAFT_593901 [Hypoxylon sp. NC1633]|nr:hypothetical protein GGR54DRAFT_593901 [Hypoxylon sp. NC1633]
MDPISMQGPSASQATAQEDRFLNHIPQRRAPRDNPPSFAPQRPAPRNDPFSFNPQISAPKDDRWDPQGRGPNSGEEPAVPKPLRLHKKAEKMDLAGTQGPSAPRATAQEDNTLNYIPQRSAPNNDLWDPEDRGYTSEEEFFAGKGRMLGGKWWPNRSDVDEWLEIQKRCGRARPDENASLLYARYTPPLQLLPPEERLGFALQRDREVHEDFEVHENYKVYENYTVHEDYLDHDDYQYHNRQKGQRMSSAQNTTLGHVAQMDEASADIPQLPRTNKAPAPYKTKTEAEYVAEVYRARKARKYRPTLPSILSQQEPEENREPEKHDDPDEAGSLLIKGFEDSVDVQPRVDTLRTLTGHHHRDSNKSEDFIQHDLPPMSGANGDIAILSQSANPSLSSRRNAIMGYKNDSRLTNKEDDAGQPQQIFSDTSFVTRQKHPYYFDKRGLFGKNVDYWPAASTAHKRFPRSKACACIGKPGPGWPNNGNPDLKSASLEDAQSVTEGNEQSATQSHSFDEVEKEAGSKTSNESEQSATPDKVETKASNRASNESEQSATPDNAENKSGNRFGNGSEETAKPDEVEKKASDRTSNESEQSATPDEAEKKAGSNTTQRGEASLKRVKRNMGILIEMCKAMILFTQNDVYHKRMDAIERRLKDLEEALKRH